MIFCGVKRRGGGGGRRKQEEDDAAAADDEKRQSVGQEEKVNFLQGSEALPVSTHGL